MHVFIKYDYVPYHNAPVIELSNLYIRQHYFDMQTFWDLNTIRMICICSYADNKNLALK